MKFSPSIALFLTSILMDASATHLRGTPDGASDPSLHNQRELQVAEPVAVWVHPYNHEDEVWRQPLLEPAPAYYACGAELSMASSSIGGAVGLRLHMCHKDEWHRDQRELEVFSTCPNCHNPNWPRPEWQGKALCPADSFIHGAQVKTGTSVGYIGGLKLFCKNPDSGVEASVDVPGETDNQLDEWQELVKLDQDLFVKGAQVRYTTQEVGATRWNGLNFMAEEMHYGVSRALIDGRWSLVSSAPKPEYEVTTSMDVTTSKQVTNEQSKGFYQEIAGGFSFEFMGLGSSMEVTIGSEESVSTARSVESTLSQVESETLRFSCDGSSPTGRWFLWQWMMKQNADGTGPGFYMRSNHVDCTPDYFEPPRCPLGFCKDPMCLTCHAPFEHLSKEDYVSYVGGNTTVEVTHNP